MVSKKTDFDLLPPPRRLRPGAGQMVLSGPLSIAFDVPDPGGGLRAFVRKTLAPVPVKLRVGSPREVANAPELRLAVIGRDPGPEAGRLYSLDAADRRALASSFGQGYILRACARTHTLMILGAGLPGLRYGLLTFRQWLRPHGDSGWVVPDAHIRDYPGFPYRSLDWLLNAEANRWGYDRGDGRAAYTARVERALDRVHGLKLNLVQFDGFGWDAFRFPGYARMMRRFNAYARARDIALVFGGYGGGYGASFQRQFVKQGRLWGRIFENRRRYPSGPVYRCTGMSKNYPEETIEHSRTLGTCLSNRALRALKIHEIVTFVRNVEPGALYIHDIDSADYEATTRSWRMRCDACRARWPNDTLEAPDGAAGAYADWFTQVRKAVSKVRNPSGYSGETCLTLFAGPLYTTQFEDDRTWARECAYFKTLSAGVPAGENVHFILREQTARRPGRPGRVRQLSRILAARGHGCAVHAYAGGDLYANDHLFTPLPAAARWFDGARAVNLAHGHVHQDALQALDAVYLWNPDAAGALPDPGPTDRLPLNVFRSRYSKADFPGVFGKGAWLETICRRLYGERAFRPMARLLGLMSPQGYGPTAILWFPFTRRLWNGDNLFDARFTREWRERWAVNRRALDRVSEACEQVEDAQVQQDVEWLRTCLDVATHLLQLLVTYSGAPALRSPDVRRRFARDHRALAARVERAGRFAFTDPLGGDVGAWRPAVMLLKDNFERALASPPADGYPTSRSKYPSPHK